MDVVSKIIQTEIIDKMPLIIEVVSIDTLDLTVCTTAWVRIGTIFKDDNDVEFKVTAFTHNESITVNNVGFVGNVHLTKPHFMWGTRVQTYNEYQQKSSYSEDKLPMIWLQDGAISDIKDNQSTIGADISCNIYFLDTYNEVWINDQIALNSLSPMKFLSNLFKNTLENNFTFFQSLNGYSEVENTRFGREDDNGVINRHFGDDLSGVGVRLSMSSYANEECCGLINVTPSSDYVRLSNSDDSFIVNIPNGNTYELEDIDITVKDQNGNILTVETIPSAIDDEIIVNVADGTVNILNSVPELIQSVTVGSGQTEDYTLPDTTINFHLDFETESVTFPTLKDEIINITLV